MQACSSVNSDMVAGFGVAGLALLGMYKSGLKCSLCTPLNSQLTDCYKDKTEALSVRIIHSIMPGARCIHIIDTNV